MDFFLKIKKYFSGFNIDFCFSKFKDGYIFWISALVVLLLFFYAVTQVDYYGGPKEFIIGKTGLFGELPAPNEPTLVPTQVPTPVHLKTPDSVKAIYMTSWVSGTKDWRASLVQMIEETELNAVVIDVKDYTGKIFFKTDDPVIYKINPVEVRAHDLKDFITHLHRKNIYTIARISVFQDPHLAKVRPDLAVKRTDGAVWKDRKGLSWVDPASPEVWDYTVRIAKETEKMGFDELNFDYIRFPSDGNMSIIKYTFYDGKISRAEALKNFFAYLKKELSSANVPLSADLFGMTTWNTDDLNIGQVLENAAPYFDYIAPMVYPSHYPATFQGFKNPAEHPYEIVNTAMIRASERLTAASSTPLKLRPWLQDFDMGAEYDAPMVKKQMQAVYDAGLTSWMLWDPSNKYTRAALSAVPTR
jgi:hypothetical protein